VPRMLRVELAEQRMAEALLRLGEAQRQGAAPRELMEWEHAYMCEVHAYMTASRAVDAVVKAGGGVGP